MNTRIWITGASGAASLIVAAGIGFAIHDGGDEGSGVTGAIASHGQPGDASPLSLAEQRLGCDGHGAAPAQPEQVAADVAPAATAGAVSSAGAAAGDDNERVADAVTARHESAPAAPSGPDAIAGAAAAPAQPSAAAVQQAPAPTAAQPVSRFADIPSGSLPAVKDAPAVQPAPVTKPGQPAQAVSRFADDGDSMQVEQARAAPFPGKMKPMATP